MLKKRLYTALSVIICCFAAKGLRAQVTVTIPASNITTQADYTSSNVPSGSFPPVGLLTAATLRSSDQSFVAITPATNNTIPLGKLFYKVNTVSGAAAGGVTEIALSNATPGQTIYSILISLFSVPFTADYRISIAGQAWQAGNFAATLSYFNATPATQTLTLVVPSLLTANTLAAALSTMSVTTLAPFRTGGGISATNTFDYFTTVPTDLSIKAASGAFSFSTTQLYNSVPSVTPDKLSSILSGSYAGAAVNPSTTDQRISASTGVPVVLTNKNSFTNTLSISPANLASNFVQAGTYTLPLTYTAARASTASYPTTLTSITTNTSVQVTVGKISELTIPGSTTATLNFTTAAAYGQGMTAALSNPVTVSSTVPYNVTVKASGDFISGANSIPIGVAILEATPAQTGTITPIVLSAAAQALITAANPVIDRPVNLQVRIPSTQTSNLLAKPAGTYTTTITFTIVAP